MPSNRNEIFDALWERLQSSLSNVEFSSRIWNGESQLNGLSAKTAMFLIKGDEDQIQQRGMPPRWHLEADVILLAKVTEADPEQPPMEVLNDWCDELEAALKMQAGESAPGAPFSANPDLQYGTTLGGLCTSCTYAGKITVVEGTIGKWGYIYAPLLITVAG